MLLFIYRNNELELPLCKILVEKVVLSSGSYCSIVREKRNETYRNIAVTVHFHLWSRRLTAFRLKRLHPIFIKIKII